MRYFLLQIFPNNLTRILMGHYGLQFFVHITNRLRSRFLLFYVLLPTEVENVRIFAESHHLAQKSHVILFECSAEKWSIICNTWILQLQFQKSLLKRFLIFV